MKKILIILIFGIVLTESILALNTANQTLTGELLPFHSDILDVHSPEQDYIYNSRRILINISSEDYIDYLKYSDNGKSFRTLCRNCDSYVRSKTFNEGFHELIIQAVFPLEVINKTINFTIDSTKPRISKTLPRRNSIVNGSEFYIKYTEDNLENITLFWNGTKTLSGCLSGKNQECRGDMNLSDYENQWIEYWFEIIDIAGSKDVSRKTKVKVDGVSPFINSIDSEVDGNRVNIIINITELNLDKVEYKDLNEDVKRQRWRRACSRLKNGICEKKVRFKGDTPNMIIRVLDDAGNSDEGIV